MKVRKKEGKKKTGRERACAGGRETEKEKEERKKLTGEGQNRAKDPGQKGRLTLRLNASALYEGL